MNSVLECLVTLNNIFVSVEDYSMKVSLSDICSGFLSGMKVCRIIGVHG